MDKVLQAFALQGAPTTTPAQIKEATTWLEQFQATTEAWQVADQLLAQPADGSTAVSTPVHIFAAQTMRTKIQYDWPELPPESHASLRASLLAHILRFGVGPQAVLTQLSLAVGVLALHMDEWHSTVVTDLITSLTTPPEQAMAKLPCLLELLTVLPEEAENYKVGVLPRSRENFRAMLRTNSPQVFQLLGEVCKQCQSQANTAEGQALLERMLRATATWLRHHAPESDQLAALPVLPFCFDALGLEPVFDAASDMIVELVHTAAAAEEAPHLVPPIAERVLTLVARYDNAVAAEDIESARAYCRIFAEAGEQFLRVLIRQPEQWALPMARAVLRGAEHPEPEVAEITFNFWYVLSEELAGSGRMLSESERPVAKALFAPLFLQVVHALRVLIELPEDSDGWAPDMQDDFKRFRYAVGDAIFDSCKVAGSVNVISNLYATLKAKMAEFVPQPHAHWRAVEGCVYCLRQSISPNDPDFFASPIVGEILSSLPSLPPIGSLQSTAIRTIGTYANWLQRNPQLLPPLLDFVANGLKSEATTAASAQAMKHLCDACAEHLAQEQTISQLLAMYLGTLSLSLQPADRVDLISALASVVSHLDVSRIPDAMKAIAQPLVERLSAALNGQTSTPNEVAVALEQLCALLRGVSPAQTRLGWAEAEVQKLGGHPSVLLLQSLWEVLNLVFTRHGTSSNCMEKLCRCYKHTARNCGESFRVLVPKLLPQVCAWFEQHPHSCFLYMTNVCLSAFGHGERAADLLPLFADSYRRMTVSTFQLLSASLVDNPDVVDDFFELCGKVLRYQPQLLLESELLTPAYQCGCAALHLQHREAGRSAFRFFDNLIDLVIRPTRGACTLSEASLGALRALLGQHGQQLVTAIITAIAGALPASRVRLVAPLLKLLIEVESDMCRTWANTTMSSLPAETHADGAVFIGAAFSREALCQEKVFINAAEAFSEACRRKKAQL